MFPLDTVDFAHQKAETLKESLHSEGKDISPENLARKLYELGAGVGYGYWEAIQQGIWFRYPHEVVAQAECGELATYLYVIGKSLDLKPRILSAEGIEQTNDIVSDTPNIANHLFIDVEVGKTRWAIDPLYRNLGPVEYHDHTVHVNKKPGLKPKTLAQLSEGGLVDEIELSRKPKGLIRMLSDGQRLKRGVLYHDSFPSITSAYTYFDPTSGTLILFATALECIGDTHSKMKRTYTFGDGNVQTTDDFFDILLTPDGNKLLRETKLNDQLEPEDNERITTYFAYRKNVLEIARNSGKQPNDTYLYPNEELFKELHNFLHPDISYIPNNFYPTLGRRADYRLFRRNHTVQPAQCDLDEYLVVKFSREKFGPYLEMGDYLAERAKEVLSSI